MSLATDNTPITLWQPIQQTVLRRAFGSGRAFGEGQALTVMEALRCATANGAYLTFDEAKKGSLEVGKFADLAVLSANPLTGRGGSASASMRTHDDGRRQDRPRDAELARLARVRTHKLNEKLG